MDSYHIPTKEELISLCLNQTPFEIIYDYQMRPENAHRLTEKEKLSMKGHLTHYFKLGGEIYGSFKQDNGNVSGYQLSTWENEFVIKYIRYQNQGLDSPYDVLTRRKIKLIYKITQLPELPQEKTCKYVKELLAIDSNLKELVESLKTSNWGLVLGSRIVRTLLWMEKQTSEHSNTLQGLTYPLTRGYWQQLYDTKYHPFFLMCYFRLVLDDIKPG